MSIIWPAIKLAVSGADLSFKKGILPICPRTNNNVIEHGGRLARRMVASLPLRYLWLFLMRRDQQQQMQLSFFAENIFRNATNLMLTFQMTQPFCNVHLSGELSCSVDV